MMHDCKTLNSDAGKCVILLIVKMCKQNITEALSCQCYVLTICFHHHCGEFGVSKSWVLDHTGHAVLFLQVGGEAEDAAQGGGSVRVNSITHIHSKRVI